MKAISFRPTGATNGPATPIELELPIPVLRPNDLLVRVMAVSVNRIDVTMREKPPTEREQPRVAGYDASGVVEAVGDGVTEFQPGDEVFYAGAIDRQGCYAEFQAVDERLVGAKPGSLCFADAAALPLTSLTAWELLFDRLRVSEGRATRGEALLVINGAGGVGSILIQIARRLTDLTVIATASRPESMTWCREMGAHHVIDHDRALTEGLTAIGIPQVRYVASLGGSEDRRDEIVAALTPQGALGIIDAPRSFDVTPFRSKSLSIHWEGMFTRSLHQTPDMIRQQEILNEMSALLDDQILRTTRRENFGTMNVDSMRRAHAALESGRTIGKIVLDGF